MTDANYITYMNHGNIMSEYSNPDPHQDSEQGIDEAYTIIRPNFTEPRNPLKMNLAFN